MVIVRAYRLARSSGGVSNFRGLLLRRHVVLRDDIGVRMVSTLKLRSQRYEQQLYRWFKGRRERLCGGCQIRVAAVVMVGAVTMVTVRMNRGEGVLLDYPLCCPANLEQVRFHHPLHYQSFKPNTQARIARLM